MTTLKTPTAKDPTNASVSAPREKLIALWNNRWVRFAVLTLYYLAILLGLIYLYGKGDFSTPPFIYQGF
jgi:hypothetical protein